MQESDPHERAYSAALRFISSRPRTEGEVRLRLVKEYPAEVVDETLVRLKEEGHINDALYSRLWRQSRSSLHPRAARAVKRELISKGVKSETASEAVEGMDDAESAYRAASKHARLLGSTDLRTFQRKMWGYLQRRGYSEGLTKRIAMKVWDDLHAGPPTGPEERSEDA